MLLNSFPIIRVRYTASNRFWYPGLGGQRMNRYSALLVTLFSFSLFSLAYAGFEDGKAAYDKGDYVTAYKEFKTLAEQGDGRSQFYLGVMYYGGEGKGVAQNYAEAVKWFRKAADQGNIAAQSNLGWIYYEGQGVAKDYAEAVKWFRKAAEQGNAEAQYNLGVMYDEGRGVKKDLVQAYMWFSLAGEQGNSEAQKDRDITAQKMTPSQIAEAQRLAREWKPMGQ
jgi:TPR repeat protein